MMSDNLVTNGQFLEIIHRDPKEILQLMLEVAQHSRHDPYNAPLVKFDTIPKDPPKNVFIKDFGWLFSGEGKCRRVTLNTLENAKFYLQQRMMSFRFMTYNGYVLAGSAVVCACIHNFNERYSAQDFDFFLVQEEPKNAVVSYIQILTDINKGLKEKEIREDSTITRRNENCTTISIEEYGNHHERVLPYQIIHRCHKSKASVIVGFDQVACKAFYDGDNIYFTLDAALAMYFGINPVDWKRESPSHLRRTNKYHDYGFQAIFPGLPFNVVDWILEKKVRDKWGNMNYRKYVLPGCALQVTKITSKRQKAFARRRRNHIPEENTIAKIDFSFLHFEAPESDYGGDGDITVDTVMNYTNVSHAINDKLHLVSVFCHNPMDILDDVKYTKTEAWPVLCKVTGETDSDIARFYFGTGEFYNTLHECKILVKTFPLSTENMGMLNKLNNEMFEIKSERAIELDAKLAPAHENLKQIRFNTSNPGTQFTASFNPTIRKHPKDYWGHLYQDFPMYDFQEVKFAMVTIWKRGKGESPLGIISKDVLKMIFKWLWHAQMNLLVEKRRNEYNTSSKYREVGAEGFCYPWHYDPKKDTSSKYKTGTIETIENELNSMDYQQLRKIFLGTHPHKDLIKDIKGPKCIELTRNICTAGVSYSLTFKWEMGGTLTHTCQNNELCQIYTENHGYILPIELLRKKEIEGNKLTEENMERSMGLVIQKSEVLQILEDKARNLDLDDNNNNNN